ncbi:hypothetical protein COV19_04400 [Candidatus Woesearchaeota archaeon CG10_big_fil_rev_8_21_14_0_10_44_13]|nr:MAG: hypothetical protein COV19_04400 [Candidatus Woesearchaeota archaeon CG10_big_fil_rev_8_21_14_0_10_44_13]
MKKQYFIIIMAIVFLSVMSIPVSAAPAWKKTSNAPATTTTATQPQVIEKVIIQNNTVVQQSAAPKTNWYEDWNFIAIVIAVIGALGGWLISRKIRGKTAKYMTEIDHAYRTYRKNANKCEAELAGVREKIEDDFKKGKLNDNSLAILDARIDKYSKELRNEVIDKGFKLPPDLNKKIKHMLSDGIITKEEYGHFAKGIENEQLSKQDKEELNKLMKKWRDEDKR